MTEYDFSPAAQQAYQDKLKRIAKWSANVPGHHELLSNPFVPSTGDDREFHSKQPRRRKSMKRKPTRREGYETEGEDESERDDEGPDRPPTPPASAPAFGMGFYAQGSPYYYQQQQQQQPFRPMNVQPPPLSSNVLVPVWNGSAYVYQPQTTIGAVSYVAPPLASPGISDGYDHAYADRDRGRGMETKKSGSGKKKKHTTHRRNSQSVPAFGSFYYNNNSNYLYPNPNVARLSANTSPASSIEQWTTRSAPLPLPAANPGSYFPPQHPYAPQTQYFPRQPQAFSPQSMMVTSPGGYQVAVQSPAGSVHSGHAPPAMYGYPYGAPVQGPGYTYGYGYGGAQQPGYGSYGGQQPVVIMDGAKAKKAKKSAGGRSLFDRLTGGM